MFLMIDSIDHLSPKTGLSPTVTLSKNGAAFAAPSGAVTEVGSGWYKVAGNATDTATLGPLILHATATGADVVDVEYGVVAFDPQAATNLGLSNLDALISSRMATYTQPTGFLAATFPATIASTTNITAATGIVLSGVTHTGAVIPTVTTVTNQLTTAQIATGIWTDTTSGDFTVAASIGKSIMNGVALGTGLTIVSVSGSVGSVTGLTASNLDVAVSSRLATAGYTAPTNLTAAQIATGVWQDTTAGDFTVALSVGKSLMNGVALGTGLTIVSVSGSVGSVTGAVGSVTGSVASVTGNVGGSVGSVTGLTPSTISTQVASDLATAHGAGSWATATGFSTLTQADIRTATGLASANLDTQLLQIRNYVVADA
jgi:hypothetical protein